MFQFITKVIRYAIFRILQLSEFIEQLIYALIGFLRSWRNHSEYGIKAGYFTNKENLHFNDTSNEDEYQNEVYQYAAQLMSKNQMSKVIDIGCGSAFKLMKYMSDYDTTGIDVKETFDFLQQKYPQRNWLEVSQVSDAARLTADLIICADVIEHVEDPSEILRYINKIRGWKYLIISTPDRDIARGRWSYGPPPNKFHIREWNKKEALTFLANHFDIQESTITNKLQSTHMLVCKKKDLAS